MSKEILIEFYDEVNLENVISLEKDRYAQVVFLYFADAPEPTQDGKDLLRRFIQRRCGIPTEFRPIHERSIAGVCTVFDEILHTRRGVIDMTGGAELFSAAAGHYVAQGKDVILQQYDVRRHGLVFRHGGEDKPAAPLLMLSVKDAAELQGALVLSSHRYDSSDKEMEEQILRLWDAVKDDPRSWNTFCSLPGFSRTFSGNRFEKSVTAQRERDAYQRIMPRLHRLGIVGSETSHVVKGHKYKSFRLDVPKHTVMLHRKGGNLLEMYCALAAARSGCFQDCHVSVEVDWDSEIIKNAPDTRNEVDVMATSGYTPVLISCKNTRIENEYLYEIMVMAKHYGGRYARGAIVSSVECQPNVRLRAEEMGIVLIDNVQELSLDEFTAEFRRHFS